MDDERLLRIDLRIASLEEQIRGVDPLSVDAIEAWLLEDLRPLGVFQKLVRLDLQNSKRLVSLAGIGRLSNLRWLNLMRSESLASLSDMEGLTRLQQLALNGCKSLTSLAGVERLTTLRQLQLFDCKALSALTSVETLTNLQHLTLDGCTGLESLRGIECLTRLQRLNLNVGDALASLAGIERLANLQQLDLSWRRGLIDLTCIEPLVTLRVLVLYGCSALKSLVGIERLTRLEELYLYDCDGLTELDAVVASSNLQVLEVKDCPAVLEIADMASMALRDLCWYAENRPVTIPQPAPAMFDRLVRLQRVRSNLLAGVPREVQSTSPSDDCLARLRDWWAELQRGEARQREVRICILGNSRAGKTQIRNRLLGRPFDPDAPSTHGVERDRFDLLHTVDGRPALTGRLWDFGGQEIYHGTHALFLDPGAIFVVVWNPEVEIDQAYWEDGVPQRHRPRPYWLDFVRTVAGRRAAVIVVQSQADRFERATDEDYSHYGFDFVEQTRCSALNDDLDRLHTELRYAARRLLERSVPVRLPQRWVDIRDRLQDEKRLSKTMPLPAYRRLCETTGVLAPDAVLHWLKEAGEVFHAGGAFGDDIVLDVDWALASIYAMFERKNGAFQSLMKHRGRFDREWLRLYVRDDDFREDDRSLFLSMMERCSIAFKLDEGSGNYVAPDALPDRVAIGPDLESRWNGRSILEEVHFHYAVLHEGISRQLVCVIGRATSSDRLLWQYGGYFYESRAKLWAYVAQEPAEAGAAPWAGRIVVRIAGSESEAVAAAELRSTIEQLVRRAGPLDDAAIVRTRSSRLRHPAPGAHRVADFATCDTLVARPVVLLSFAGTDDDAEGGLRQAVLDALRDSLDRRGYDARDYHRHLETGGSIRAFASEIGTAEQSICIVSAKYVRSTYCMREQYFAWSNKVIARDWNWHALFEAMRFVVMPDLSLDGALGPGTDALVVREKAHWLGLANEVRERIEAEYARRPVDPDKLRALELEEEFLDVVAKRFRDWMAHLCDAVHFEVTPRFDGAAFERWLDDSFPVIADRADKSSVGLASARTATRT